VLPLAIVYLYDLIRTMRTPGRPILFIGLTNTLLTDDVALASRCSSATKVLLSACAARPRALALSRKVCGELNENTIASLCVLNGRSGSSPAPG